MGVYDPCGHLNPFTSHNSQLSLTLPLSKWKHKSPLKTTVKTPSKTTSSSSLFFLSAHCPASPLGLPFSVGADPIWTSKRLSQCRGWPRPAAAKQCSIKPAISAAIYNNSSSNLQQQQPLKMEDDEQLVKEVLATWLFVFGLRGRGGGGGSSRFVGWFDWVNQASRPK